MEQRGSYTRLTAEAQGVSRKTAPKVLLIIPAYNEVDNIARVAGTLDRDYSQYDYLVVNDGSRDGTGDECRAHGYRLLDLPINLGLSGAFQAGIKYAYEHGYDCAIQFDADGQHLPEYIESLVKALEGSDIVIGSRFIKGEKQASMRMFGSSLLSGMIRFTTGKHLTDPTSGMRAYGPRAIAELVTGPNLGPEPDTIAYLMKKKGLSVSEVPVTMAERQAGESYLNWKSSSSYMIRMTISVLLIQFFR